MTEKLDVLVVEDSPLHQEAARQLLNEHNLTLVGTFDEAADVMRKGYDAVLTDMFFTQGRGDCMADKSMGRLEMPFGYAVALMACREGVPNVAVVSDASHHANPIAYTMDFLRNENHEAIIQQVGNSKLAVINSPGLIKPIAYKTADGRIETDHLVDEYSIPMGPGEPEVPTGRKIFSNKLPENAKVVKNWAAALDYVLKGNIWVPSRK